MKPISGNLAYKTAVKKQRVLPVRIISRQEDDEILIAKRIGKQMARQRASAIFSVIILVAVITAAFSGILVRQSEILELNYANARLEREIITLENETKAIREELTKRTDLREIRELAISRLMMQDPGEKQIARVVIPDSDMLIVHYNSPISADTGGMDEIFNNLEGFFKRIR